MTYPEWGKALIECANPPCKWRGYETEMIPDPSPVIAPRGKITSIENVCPQCKKAGYYFVEEPK